MGSYAQGILIDLVYLTEVTVVGILQVGRDEQESIAFSTECLFRKVFSLNGLDGEIVDGRHVAFLDEHILLVNECPRGVGVFFERELLPFSVFLHDESCFKLGLFSPSGISIPFCMLAPT